MDNSRNARGGTSPTFLIPQLFEFPSGVGVGGGGGHGHHSCSCKPLAVQPGGGLGGKNGKRRSKSTERINLLPVSVPGALSPPTAAAAGAAPAAYLIPASAFPQEAFR